MTWIVRLTPSDEAIRAGAQESLVIIPSNEVGEFLNSYRFSWNNADKLLRLGTLRKIEVDYVPTP